MAHIAWRIRFDGYGKGMQDPTERPRRREDQDADSLNQPRGPSHVGGTFAEISLPPCPCADPRVECVCKKKANGLAKDMTKGKEIAGLISA